MLKKPGQVYTYRSNSSTIYTRMSLLCSIVGNADRHHYETYAKAKKHGKLLHIDNGKR